MSFMLVGLKDTACGWSGTVTTALIMSVKWSVVELRSLFVLSTDTNGSGTQRPAWSSKKKVLTSSSVWPGGMSARS